MYFIRTGSTKDNFLWYGIQSIAQSKNSIDEKLVDGWLIVTSNIYLNSCLTIGQKFCCPSLNY